jgi:hypothetical protein
LRTFGVDVHLRGVESRCGIEGVAGCAWFKVGVVLAFQFMSGRQALFAAECAECQERLELIIIHNVARAASEGGVLTRVDLAAIRAGVQRMRVRRQEKPSQAERVPLPVVRIETQRRCERRLQPLEQTFCPTRGCKATSPAHPRRPGAGLQRPASEAARETHRHEGSCRRPALVQRLFQRLDRRGRFNQIACGFHTVIRIPRTQGDRVSPRTGRLLRASHAATAGSTG